jgi:hypothetical protein
MRRWVRKPNIPGRQSMWSVPSQFGSFACCHSLCNTSTICLCVSVSLPLPSHRVHYHLASHRLLCRLDSELLLIVLENGSSDRSLVVASATAAAGGECGGQHRRDSQTQEAVCVCGLQDLYRQVSMCQRRAETQSTKSRYCSWCQHEIHNTGWPLVHRVQQILPAVFGVAVVVPH